MNGQTVLVVEDNALNLKLMRNLLQLAEYNVLEATNAETGLQMARDSQPDLILMDVQLPGIDGLEATRTLRADAEIKHIPVVAVTSYAMQGDQEACLAAGCDGYLSKPLDTRRFEETIRRFTRVNRQKTF